MKKIFLLLCLAALPLPLSGSPASRDGKLFIQVKPEIMIKADHLVRLDQIAEITGKTAFWREKVGSLIIASAPAPGGKRTISTVALENRIYRTGLRPGDFLFHSPQNNKVTIYRGKAYLKENKIKNAIESFFHKRFPGEDIHIHNIKFHAFPLAQGEYVYRVVDPGKTDILGQISLKVSAMNTSSDYKTSFYVRLQAERKISMLVAKKPLQIGHIIQDGDFRTDTVILKSMYIDPEKFLKISKALNGRRLNSYINTGSPISKNKLQTPLAIKAGQEVEVRIAYNGIQVSRMAMAQSNARLHEPLKIRDGKHFFRAIAIGDGVVRPINDLPKSRGHHGPVIITKRH